METITREELMRITLADVKAALYPDAPTEEPQEPEEPDGEPAEKADGTADAPDGGSDGEGNE